MKDAEFISFPEDLRQCIHFHGHLCPGLIYGYRVAKEALRLMGSGRAHDEEIVAIAENDSCAVDALQVILGTTAGKGNLIVRDYGKNAFVIADRKSERAIRFSRKTHYTYGGENPSEYEQLESKFVSGNMTEEEEKRRKYLKSKDLLTGEFSAIFETEYIAMPDLPYAPLAPSVPCSLCGEMTMATKLIDRGSAGKYCIPCKFKVDNRDGA